ncbi:MAG TPA: CoA transferase, partial [Tepidiformaceae bacterium]|nr:CoA transferase [Tepidiformaceae bacterium]
NNFNSSKRGITLEMGHPDGQSVARRLIASADMVVENFRPGLMERWGLDYESLAKEHPGLIYVSMPAVASTGPRSYYAGFGTGIKMISGLTMLTGFPGRHPIGPPQAFPDYCINCGHGATAMTAALLYRRATGKGQYVEVAQSESTAAVTDSAILQYTVNGTVPKQLGNRHPIYAPQGIYQAQGDEQWLAVCATNQREWEALAAAAGHPEWVDSAEFGTLPARRRNHDLLDQAIGAWLATIPGREAERILVEAGVPAAIMQVNRDLIEDPHLAARNYYWTLDHPVLGPTVYDGAPFLLSETPAFGQRPSPCLGEHNFEVYEEAGFTAEEIGELMASGVISG